MTASSRSVSAQVARQSAEVAVGLLVPPVLLGLLAARALAEGLTQMGLASEQLFAGDRLPTLNMSHVSPETGAISTEV